jgi:hypothetical protein
MANSTSSISLAMSKNHPLHCNHPKVTHAIQTSLQKNLPLLGCQGSIMTMKNLEFFHSPTITNMDQNNILKKEV